VAGLLHAQPGAAGTGVVVVVVLFESLIIIFWFGFMVVSCQPSFSNASAMPFNLRNAKHAELLDFKAGKSKPESAMKIAVPRIGAILAPPGRHWCKVEWPAISFPPRRLLPASRIASVCIAARAG
jgi:hypothetical protein